MSIPIGLRECRSCREYKGVVLARNVAWPDSPFPALPPDTEFEVVCICENVRCPRCNRKTKRRPGSNYYDRALSELIHIPVTTGKNDCYRCIEWDLGEDEEYSPSDHRTHSDDCPEPLEECNVCGSCDAACCACECANYCDSCGDHLEDCACEGPQVP